MAALGDRVVAESPSDDVAAEGVHHLANQVACWLTYAIGHTDPAHPAFFRSSDPVYQWGGPNADQVARRAAVDGGGTYRIAGRMGTCEEFVLQVKLGAAQSGGAGVATEVAASALGLAPGDDFELVLSGTEQPGRWIALDPEAAFVHVRDYYFDWQAAEPATFVIERLDTQGDPRPPRTPARVSELLADAAREIEHSIEFWSGYQDRMLRGQARNEFGRPAGAAGGVQSILYSHALVALRDDEALVVELDPSDAPLWDVQLYNRPWYEALDVAHRVTSVNHRLVRTDADGKVRVVLAAHDPGCANWLDTEGRPEVLATVRWFRPPAQPALDARVVPSAEVAAGDDRVGPEERRNQVRRRAAHVAWRYRA
jgi:hypothetical protein